ncbi:hypothetical protein SAMN05444354_1013 [Stigmatella aurantiaca]|uniref:Uncharacterized protein n=1 Tax=Stigmatella aurantiaca TaxID=41 RepID=A0A1H7FBW6_STIAU|nr:hypothetical protein [Stigmatella aurantiaca]SEK21540.1 hypothetical protein SAMN05444354_1013 [Stigmatella aurantiaca]
MLLDVLNVLVARASLANAIAVANEDDPLTAGRVLSLALTGLRP